MYTYSLTVTLIKAAYLTNSIINIHAGINKIIITSSIKPNNYYIVFLNHSEYQEKQPKILSNLSSL